MKTLDESQQNGLANGRLYVQQELNRAVANGVIIKGSLVEEGNKTLFYVEIAKTRLDEARSVMAKLKHKVDDLNQRYNE